LKTKYLLIKIFYPKIITIINHLTAKLNEANPISANNICPRVKLASLMQPAILNPVLNTKKKIIEKKETGLVKF
jgi:hypothetical protein